MCITDSAPPLSLSSTLGPVLISSPCLPSSLCPVCRCFSRPVRRDDWRIDSERAVGWCSLAFAVVSAWSKSAGVAYDGFLPPLTAVLPPFPSTTSHRQSMRFERRDQTSLPSTWLAPREIVLSCFRARVTSLSLIWLNFNATLPTRNDQRPVTKVFISAIP